MNNKSLKLYLSAASISLIMTSPLMAQEASLPAEAASTEGNVSGDMNDIIVTAQRRSERLQDVPLSVTALDSQSLAAANATTSLDLPMVVPGLRIDATGIFIQPAIRGVSSTLSTASSESNVSTYVDGVYQQSILGSIYDLPDVESVQVLKGPQGTLFGRNATGGAILINTAKPDLSAVKGSLYASYGNYDAVVVKGFVSAPLVEDRLAVSLSGLLDRTDGWKSNLLNGGKIENSGIKSVLIRGKIRVVPWDGADFTLSGHYAKRTDNSALKLSNYEGNNISALRAPTRPIASGPWEYASDLSPFIEKTQRAVTLHGEIEVGPGTLTTTSHYDRNKSYGVIDVDNGAAVLGVLDFPSSSRNITQEFLYNTDQLGDFRAVVGLFYYNLLGRFTQNVSNFARANYVEDRTSSYAAFGEVTYSATERLSLVAGVRYSHETRTARAVTAVGTSVQPPYGLVGERSWNALTPRASILYEVSDRTNVYFTYSKGFTSGTFNSSSFQTTPVNPENVNAFEIGIKSSDIDRLTLNAAAFYYNYSDLQVLTLSQNSSGLLTSTLANAATAKIYGIEANGNWKAFDDFDLSFGATYLHARYSSFPGASVQVPTVVNGVRVGGNTAVSIDGSGNTMIRSPTFSANATAHYHTVTDAGAFDASVAVLYSSKVFFEFANRIVQPEYALVNANLTWQPKNTNLQFSVWGKNLTDKAAISSIINTALYDAIDYLPPRIYGVSAQLRF